MRAPDGTERKFTVHTREMPARRGYEVSLITTPHRRPRALALANWTTIDGANYARSEPPGLVRVGNVLWLVAGFVGTAAWLGGRGDGAVRACGGGGACGHGAVRWEVRQRLAWRTAKGPMPLY